VAQRPALRPVLQLVPHRVLRPVLQLAPHRVLRPVPHRGTRNSKPTQIPAAA